MFKRSLAPMLAFVALAISACSAGGTNYYATASAPGVNNSTGGTGGGSTTAASTDTGTATTTTTTTTTTTGGSGTTGGPDAGPRIAAGIQFVSTTNLFLGVDYKANYSQYPINTFKFRVAAADDAGVPDASVTFGAGASNAQGSTLLDSTGVPASDGGFTTFTDSQGNVSAQLQAGIRAGQVTVLAQTTLPNGHTVSAQGSSSIVGTQPSRQNSGISCSPVNIPVFYGNNPVCAVKSDYNGTTTCRVTLGDRFGNAVGVAVPVHFYSEAGLWQSQTVNTPAYGDVAGSPGIAVNTLKTAEATLPQDVTPLVGEPSYDGLCLGTLARTYNPRDGLVTVMADFAGEEAFNDQFATGYWLPGDPFTDLPEPFVDNDDSSVWKPGDACPGHNADGGCDGPNNQWDGNADIFVQNWIVYTGTPVTTLWNPDPAPDILAFPQLGEVTWADVNMNVPASATVCKVTAPTAGEPSGFTAVYPVGQNPASPPDALGMQAAEILVCDAGFVVADGGQQSNTVCYYQSIVTGFTQGFTGTYQVSESTKQDGGAGYCIYSSAILLADPPDTSSLCGIAYGP